MICVGTQPFVRIGWVQRGGRGVGGDRGMMSSQVGAGCEPGPAVAGMVLPLGAVGKEDACECEDAGMMLNKIVCNLVCVCIWVSKYVSYFILFCTVGMHAGARILQFVCVWVC